MRKKLRLISSLIAVLGVLALGAAACGSADSSGGGGALTTAIVAPSASDDLAFSQSMVDSVNALYLFFRGIIILFQIEQT